MLRQPIATAGTTLTIVILVVLGRWWMVAGVVLLAVVALAIAEHQARQRRPQWHRAVESNSEPRGLDE